MKSKYCTVALKTKLKPTAIKSGIWIRIIKLILFFFNLIQYRIVISDHTKIVEKELEVIYFYISNGCKFVFVFSLFFHNSDSFYVKKCFPWYLDGNSEIGEHNLCYLVCLRHFIRSEAITNLFSSAKKYFPSCICVLSDHLL